MYAIAAIVVIYFYVRLAMWVAKKAASKCGSKRSKWGARIAVALVFILIPTGDEIAGRIYFNHLCKTQAGVKVYKTIELPAEYWDKDGKPKFYDKRTGNLSLKLSQYAEIKSNRTTYSWGIEKRETILLDKQTHRKISEDSWFMHWGGWIKRNLSPNNTADHCGGDSKDLISKLFVAEKKQGGRVIHGNNK